MSYCVDDKKHSALNKHDTTLLDQPWRHYVNHLLKAHTPYLHASSKQQRKFPQNEHKHA